jgi:hypothetical protein
MSSNNHFVDFQDVNEEYAWVNYGEFKLLMMKNNGYVNVTKMCEEYSNKTFRDLEKKKCLEEIIKFSDFDPIKKINCGNELDGTYAHLDIAVYISRFISAEIYIKTLRISREYNIKKERELLKKNINYH